MLCKFWCFEGVWSISIDATQSEGCRSLCAFFLFGEAFCSEAIFFFQARFLFFTKLRLDCVDFIGGVHTARNACRLRATATAILPVTAPFVPIVACRTYRTLRRTLAGISSAYLFACLHMHMCMHALLCFACVCLLRLDVDRGKMRGRMGVQRADVCIAVLAHPADHSIIYNNRKDGLPFSSWHFFFLI